MERVKRFLCALLVAITMVTMVSAPLQVQAATASGNSDWKKAPTIRKRGTYTVTDKKKDRTSNLYSRYVKIPFEKRSGYLYQSLLDRWKTSVYYED